MLFNFKTENYKTFKIFKDNILPARAYFIPYASLSRLKETDIRTERYSSDKVKLLNGVWRFKYFPRVSEMPSQIETDTYAFDSVTVPSVWQFTGYEKPYYLNIRYPFKADPPHFPENCPVGIYVKELDIADTGIKRILTFLGVAGSLDLFVNGKYVGYSEGSHNTCEFDISPYLFEGKNEIGVVVHKWCNGTYLECQDMFRNNGIFRDVYITEHKDSYIYDIDVKTTYNGGKYDVDISLVNEIKSACTLKASLEYNGTPVAFGKIDAQDKVKIGFRDLSVKQWTAETPYLYDLTLTLQNGEEIIEAVRRRIGFKHIEISSNVYRFNNEKIKILGVNHHDTNPKTGYVMTVENMEEDIRIFKEYNINAVRTSHYPPDPIFLDLCDEYGIYVIDEADIECHGVATLPMRRGACSNNPEWKEHYLDRVYRMYQRDRNHPSIAMWSLGNESHGISNQDCCYDMLKKLTDIPIHYEGACRTKRWAYDVISHMYFPQKVVKRVADGKGLPKRFYTKPYFLCEYAHAMGVGAGDTNVYVDDFLRADNILGGCVWEFVDHAVYHEEGDYKYTYGGDHDEEYHDDCFCVDGLFFPDRTPHSGALQIKNCYRPVRARLVKSSVLEFKNIGYFARKDLHVSWKALNVRGEKSGELDICVEAQKTVSHKIDLPEDYDSIVLTYTENGREVAKEQIDNKITLPRCEIGGEKPQLKNSESNTVIKTATGEVTFDTKKGQIVSIKNGEKEVMNRAPLANIGFNISLMRAPLDNDRNYRQWNKYELSTERMKLISSKPVKVSDNAVTFENTYSLSSVSVKNLLRAKIIYTIYGDGKIRVNVKCTASKLIRHCPRFGVCIELKREFDNVCYFGLGDRECLADFKEHAVLGEYKMKVSALCEKYIKPQESSMRFETRQVSFTNDNETGLKFIAVNKPFSFSADHFTSYQCAKSRHQEDLGEFNSTVIHIDSYMMGAGSNSCGPKPDSKYVKNLLRGEELEFIIVPII